MSPAETTNRIGSMAFRFLEMRGVPSHYLDTVNQLDMRVREVEVFPLEMMVRGVVAGTLSRRSGLPEGTRLPAPIVEFYYRKEELGYPLLNEDHVRVLGLASPQQWSEMRRLALLTHKALVELWDRAGLELTDVRLELGTAIDGQMLVAGDLNLDSMRLWSAEASGDRTMVFQRDHGDAHSTQIRLFEALEDAWPSLQLGELLEAPAVN